MRKPRHLATSDRGRPPQRVLCHLEDQDTQKQVKQGLPSVVPEALQLAEQHWDLGNVTLQEPTPLFSTCTVFEDVSSTLTTSVPLSDT